MQRRSLRTAGGRAVTLLPLFGTNLRWADSRAHREWLGGHRAQAARAALLAAFAIALLPLLGTMVGGVWPRLAMNTALLVPLALAAVRLPWRRLFTPTWRQVRDGLLAAAFLYAAGAVIAAALTRLPAVAEQVRALYAWRDAAPAGLAIPLLLWIVLGEEIVWRTAVTLPLAGRFGPWTGVLLSALGFTAAHVSLGVPVLLLLALAAGGFWSALVVATRSSVPALVSHVLWDVAVLFVWPYV